jgi:hypothetical protein
MTRGRSSGGYITYVGIVASSIFRAAFFVVLYCTRFCEVSSTVLMCNLDLKWVNILNSKALDKLKANPSTEARSACDSF